MSKPYETRTAMVGPLRVRVELSADEYATVTEYLGDFSNEPEGLAYDIKKDILIDAEDQIDLDEIREQDEEAEEAWDEQCRADRAAKRAPVYERWERQNAIIEEWKKRGTAAPQQEYNLRERYYLQLNQIDYHDYGPRPIPEQEGRTEEGYRIIPPPEGFHCPGIYDQRNFDRRYFNLERFKKGVAGFEPEWPYEEHVSWAWNDAKQMTTYYRDDWGFIQINVTVSLAGEEIGHDSLGGVDNQSEEYVEQTVKECIHNALSVAYDNMDTTRQELNEKIAAISRYVGVPEAEWDREMKMHLAAAEWETR